MIEHFRFYNHQPTLRSLENNTSPSTLRLPQDSDKLSVFCLINSFKTSSMNCKNNRQALASSENWRGLARKMREMDGRLPARVLAGEIFSPTAVRTLSEYIVSEFEKGSHI
ncbi:unnamed protein product [Caenorhabditis angaria]|uniref:Uncharacterized protein n=1 Tax=Caenorhabditis angaria TaxID=860376 RepID=A0A9P1IPI3_9PELO|nr:unnamed protein product [Caenorhabditis angaria]